MVVAAAAQLAGCGLFARGSGLGVLGLGRRQGAPTPVVTQVADDGISGPLHQREVGHVVFSTRAVERDASDGAALTQRVRLDDPLFVRVFLSKSRGNAFREVGVVCHETDRADGVHVQFNGAPESEWVALNWVPPGARRPEWDRWTTYTFDSQSITNYAARFPDERRQSRFVWGASVVPRLNEGDNTLVFHATARCSGSGSQGSRSLELATGTLTVHVERGERERYLARFAPTLPTERHPDARTLHAPMLQTVAREWHDETPLQAVVLSEGWAVRRHPISGVAVERSVEGGVTVHRSVDPSTVCRIYRLGFTQRSLDGRAQYASFMSLSVGDYAEAPCPAAPRLASERRRGRAR